jgi:small subunit ribosomal protein S21
MTTVKLRSGESQQSLLKRFRKEVGKARILSEVRKRRWFISKSELRRQKERRGIRRAKRKLARRRRRQRW